MTLKSLLTVFVFFFGIANAYQCVEVVEGIYRRTEEIGGEQTSTNITIPVPFRHCVPDLSDISSSCQCHGIHINNTGGSDCQSLDENGNSWCYVIDDESGCSDKKQSKHNLPVHLNLKTVKSSVEACRNEPEPVSVGNEFFIRGVELEGLELKTSYARKLRAGTIPTHSHRECHKNCLNEQNKRLCGAWTYKNNICDLYTTILRDESVCYNQKNKRRRNDDAWSGYICTATTKPIEENGSGQFPVSKYPDPFKCWSTVGDKPEVCQFARNCPGSVCGLADPDSIKEASSAAILHTIETQVNQRLECEWKLTGSGWKCVRDCQWRDFSDWSPCDGVSQTRTRTKIRAVGGGRRCTGQRREFQPCASDGAACITTGGPNPGKNCIFPFTWQGTTYHGCPEDSDGVWCSTKVDNAGNHVTGEDEWGICGQNCPSHY